MVAILDSGRGMRLTGNKEPSLRDRFKTCCLILLSFFQPRIKQTGAGRGRRPFQAGLRR